MTDGKKLMRELELLNITISQKEAEIKALRETIDGVSGVSYDRGKVDSSPQADPPFVRTIMRITELSADLDKELERRSEIVKMIYSLSDPAEISLLDDRFIKGISLMDISEKTGKSYSYLAHLQGKALYHVGQQQKSAKKQQKIT